MSIGSRFAPGAHVLRGARREAVSRIYSLLLRSALRNQFRDATCGFKAARRETAQVLLPQPLLGRRSVQQEEHRFPDISRLAAMALVGGLPADSFPHANGKLIRPDNRAGLECQQFPQLSAGHQGTRQQRCYQLLKAIQIRVITRCACFDGFEQKVKAFVVRSARNDEVVDFLDIDGAAVRIEGVVSFFNKF